jgi:beta-lactam-binding protein with PASTA domain
MTTRGLTRCWISKRASLTTLGAALLVALCLGVGGCGRASDEKMPDVVGKPENAAKKTLEDLGLTVESSKKRTGAAAGTVIDQSPHAGDATPDDLKVTIIVEDATATGTGSVPDVVGKSAHEAEALLTQAGFRRGNLTPQVSPQPKDTVIEQNPKAGSNAAAGTLVDLVVADDSMATVPSVVGQNEADAIKLLADRRLRVGNVRRSLEGTGAVGLILDQNPRAELMVPRDTAVDLVIKEDGVTVPAVVNRLVNDVATTLLGSGLTYKLVYQIDPNRPWGTILATSPMAGQLVPRNSEVTLTVTQQRRWVFDPRLAREMEVIEGRLKRPQGIRVVK